MSLHSNHDIAHAISIRTKNVLAKGFNAYYKTYTYTSIKDLFAHRKTKVIR